MTEARGYFLRWISNLDGFASLVRLVKADMRILVFPALILTLIWWFRFSRDPKNCAVFVLGDVGHSPRMQNHCLSLANNGWFVHYIGHAGTRPPEALIKHRNISIRFIQPTLLTNAPWIIYAFVKILTELIDVGFTFAALPGIDFILVQNPPSIPSLFLCYIVSIFRGWKVYIDWHNFGFSILAMKFGAGSLIVRVAKFYELFFGRRMNGAMCVSKAMQKQLKEWDIDATILYDRPPSKFKVINSEQRLKVLKLLEKKPDYDLDYLLPWDRFEGAKSLCDVMSSKKPPVIAVSSTSWTKDEDFSLLSDRLARLESFLRKQEQTLIIFITGKGDLKDEFLAEVNKISLECIKVHCVWLKAPDYPRLLACADFGLSFHQSSSGLDLPMKIVDMFGAGLPVLARDFQTIGELVRKDNGIIFKDRDELLKGITELISKPQLRAKLQKGVLKFRSHTWEKEWSKKLEGTALFPKG